jgi:N-methylhydantoinase A
MQLDATLAEQAIGRLADRLGLGIPATAAGINRIVDARMADLIRRMSVMRGLDPRDFVCFAYGGGGPVHAAAVAREAGIRRVVVPIPRVGALWSALGAAAADVTHHYQEARVIDMPADPVPIADAFARLEAKARETLAGEGFGDRPITIRRSARMKFTMQVHDVEVPIGTDGDIDAAAMAALDRDFDSTYESLFGAGSGYREGGVQITSLQVRATAELPPVPFAESTTAPAVERSTRPVYWSEAGDFVETPVISLDHGALPGETFDGPLLLEFPDTVVVIRPGMHAHFDEHANVVIDIPVAAAA